jgi:hypothetical protein
MNAIEKKGSQGFTANQLSKIIFDFVLRVVVQINVTIIKTGIRHMINN